MISEQKNELRKSIKAKLKEYFLENDWKKDSDEISGKLLSIKEYKSSEIVLAFLAAKNEIDCQAVIDDAFGAKKTVAIPRVKSGTCEMDFFILNPEIPLESQIEIGSFGIREPKTNLEILDLEKISQKNIFIVNPGLAFTKDGKRLGKGKGFYDRFISCLRQKAEKIFIAGICFPFQILEEIPTDEYDVKMDCVVF